MKKQNIWCIVILSVLTLGIIALYLLVFYRPGDSDCRLWEIDCCEPHENWNPSSCGANVCENHKKNGTKWDVGIYCIAYSTDVQYCSTACAAASATESRAAELRPKRRTTSAPTRRTSSSPTTAPPEEHDKPNP